MNEIVANCQSTLTVILLKQLSKDRKLRVQICRSALNCFSIHAY